MGSVSSIGAGRCSGVDVLIELAGVEGGVIVVADGEGDWVGGSRLKSAPSAHQVHSQRLLGVMVEVESASSGTCTVRSAATASPSGRSSIGGVVAVVGR